MDMKWKKIDANFNWIDDEVAEIVCPYCHETKGVDIYEDMVKPCKCGRNFILRQRNWIEEAVKDE